MWGLCLFEVHKKCNLQCNCNVLYDSMTLKCTVIVISFKWLNIRRQRTTQSRTVDGRPKTQAVSSLLLTAKDRVWHRDWLYSEYSSLPPTASFHQCCITFIHDRRFIILAIYGVVKTQPLPSKTTW
jgi:hypothetical protein